MDMDFLYELIYMCKSAKSDISINKIRQELLKRKELMRQQKENEKSETTKHKVSNDEFKILRVNFRKS